MLGGGKGSAGSSDCERIRGVALSVPHVISCLTASGPSSEGVGEGIVGTSEKLLIVGDFGRSVEEISDMKHHCKGRVSHMVFQQLLHRYDYA